MSLRESVGDAGMTWTQALKRLAIVVAVSASFAAINAERDIVATATERRNTASVRADAGAELFDIGRLYRAARREMTEHFEQIVDVLVRRR